MAGLGEDSGFWRGQLQHARSPGSGYPQDIGSRKVLAIHTGLAQAVASHQLTLFVFHLGRHRRQFGTEQTRRRRHGVFEHGDLAYHLVQVAAALTQPQALWFLLGSLSGDGHHRWMLIAKLTGYRAAHLGEF